jgi:hypothetical protein
MKTAMLACILAGALVLAPFATAREPSAHDHAHAAGGATVTVPAGGWATDAPLRKGMARVRTALDELRHYEMGHMPRSLAVGKADEVEDAIGYLFANCHLEADADAALHAILVPLLAAVQRFRTDPADTGAIPAMRAAVADYPRLFDDPQARAPAAAGEASHDGPGGGNGDG